MSDNRQWQVVIITASDGTKHQFTGPAAFHQGTPLKIRHIEFTEPSPMPSDCFWETITPVLTNPHPSEEG